MFHLKSKSNFRVDAHRSPHKKWVVGELTLAIAALVLMTVFAWRANAAQWTRVLNSTQPYTINEHDAYSNSDVSQTDQLIAVLQSPDPGIRVSAAQTLGALRAAKATDALLSATYDSSAWVRQQAAAALGQIGAIRAEPRLRELAVEEGNSFVKTEALQAQEQIMKQVATSLAVPRPYLQTLAITQKGTAFAVVTDQLYTTNPDGAWIYVGELPDAINDMAIAPDGTLFLATRSAGIHRSQNGGHTWEYLNFGAFTPTQLTTTAVVVDPQNSQRVFVALAVTNSDKQENSVGISQSNDSGKTWLALENSPAWSVTRQLIIDHTTPQYLYGLADGGPWRYALPLDVGQPN